MRAADCDTPGCADRMEGANDDELFRAVRHHANTIHPTDKYTDEQLKDWMATAAYIVRDPLLTEQPS
jgi:predicted small metal-binding protein